MLAIPLVEKAVSAAEVAAIAACEKIVGELFTTMLTGNNGLLTKRPLIGDKTKYSTPEVSEFKVIVDIYMKIYQPTKVENLPKCFYMVGGKPEASLTKQGFQRAHADFGTGEPQALIYEAFTYVKQHGIDRDDSQPGTYPNDKRYQVLFFLYEHLRELALMLGAVEKAQVENIDKLIQFINEINTEAIFPSSKNSKAREAGEKLSMRAVLGNVVRQLEKAKNKFIEEIEKHQARERLNTIIKYNEHIFRKLPFYLACVWVDIDIVESFGVNQQDANSQVLCGTIIGRVVAAIQQKEKGAHLIAPILVEIDRLIKLPDNELNIQINQDKFGKDITHKRDPKTNKIVPDAQKIKKYLGYLREVIDHYHLLIIVNEALKDAFKVAGTGGEIDLNLECWRDINTVIPAYHELINLFFIAMQNLSGILTLERDGIADGKPVGTDMVRGKNISSASNASKLIAVTCRNTIQVNGELRFYIEAWQNNVEKEIAKQAGNKANLSKQTQLLRAELLKHGIPDRPLNTRVSRGETGLLAAPHFQPPPRDHAVMAVIPLPAAVASGPVSGTGALPAAAPSHQQIAAQFEAEKAKVLQQQVQMAQLAQQLEGKATQLEQKAAEVLKLEQERRDAKIANTEPQNMFKVGFGILADPSLQDAEKIRQLGLLPKPIQDIIFLTKAEKLPEPLQAMIAKRRTGNDFMVSCKKWVDHTLYTPALEIPGWLNSYKFQDLDQAEGFKLTAFTEEEDGVVHFELISSDYRNPIYVCGDYIGGLISPQRSQAEYKAEAEYKALGDQRKLILMPLIVRGQCYFILSSKAYAKTEDKPPYTLYINDFGRVVSYKGEDPGEQGHFVIRPRTALNLDVALLPVVKPAPSANAKGPVASANGASTSPQQRVNAGAPVVSHAAKAPSRAQQSFFAPENAAANPNTPTEGAAAPDGNRSVAYASILAG